MADSPILIGDRQFVARNVEKQINDATGYECRVDSFYEVIKGGGDIDIKIARVASHQRQDAPWAGYYVYAGKPHQNLESALNARDSLE